MSEPPFAGAARQANLGDACVAVVGLGLMGGSLAGALKMRRACRRVVGVARRRSTLDEAQRRGWIDAGATNLAAGVADADLVILATPPRVIIAQLDELGPAAPAGCVVMDLGSVKSAIVQAMERLPAGVYPLGGHPMCGKEQAGLEAADPLLFEGRRFVLTPLERTPASTLALGRALALAIGAQPLVLDAETHDRMVAWVSHLPHLAALALVRAVMVGARRDPQVWSLAASGFRDTSRLAASDLTMLLDIFIANREPVLATLQTFQSELTRLGAALEREDEPALRQLLDEAITQRREVCG